MSHGSKKEVQAKKTEALKRLGHKNLKLDEYESAFVVNSYDHDRF
jgi:ATPase family AAA domain-containing protein 1